LRSGAFPKGPGTVLSAAGRVKSFDDPMAGALASCCGVNLAWGIRVQAGGDDLETGAGDGFRGLPTSAQNRADVGHPADKLPQRTV